jgi:hypothetical protein
MTTKTQAADPAHTTLVAAQAGLVAAEAAAANAQSRQGLNAARLGAIHDERAAATAELTDLRRRAAFGDDVADALRATRARLQLLDLEQEDVEAIDVHLREEMTRHTQAVADAQTRVNEARAEIRRAERATVVEQLNGVAREYERMWAAVVLLDDAITDLTGYRPPEVEIAKREIVNFAASFGHTSGGRLLRLPTLGTTWRP